MAREIRSEAWLAQLMAKAGYNVREQFKSAEIIDTLHELQPGAPVRKDDASITSQARPGLVPQETDVLHACLEALAMHPAVAWAVRINSGGMHNPSGQYVKFSFTGCSDILGQMRDGRLLAIEVKRPGGVATDHQRAFLDRVRAAHGVSFVAWSVDDVIRELKRAA